MIQLTIDDNLRTTFLIGNQRIFCDHITVDVEPGYFPDIRIDGLSLIVDSDATDNHDMEV